MMVFLSSFVFRLITKTPLKVRAGVIDRGYTGEIFVNAVNVSQNEFTLQQHQKLPFQKEYYY